MQVDVNSYRAKREAMAAKAVALKKDLGSLEHSFLRLPVCCPAGGVPASVQHACCVVLCCCCVVLHVLGCLPSSSCLALLHRPDPASAPANRSTRHTGSRPRPASLYPSGLEKSSTAATATCRHDQANTPRHCCCHRHLTDLATASCAVVARPSHRARRESSTRPGTSLSMARRPPRSRSAVRRAKGPSPPGNDDDALPRCSAASALCALAVSLPEGA